MKIGFRTPSIKKSVKARTTGKIKRTVSKTVNPLYGKKGVGFVKSPTRSVKNSIYHKLTFGLGDVISGSDKYSCEDTQFTPAEQPSVLPFFDIPVVAQHFDFMENVVENYNRVTKNKEYFGKYAENVISNGKKDIAIAAEFIKCCNENNELLPTYPSFKILALLYEHRKEYKEALDVCQQAVSLGFVDDGTKGTMTKRIEKLEKMLSNKTS